MTSKMIVIENSVNSVTVRWKFNFIVLATSSDSNKAGFIEVPAYILGK